MRIYVENLDTAAIREVTLFPDGCPGQNKNSVMTAMLIHSVSTLENIDSISRLYSEPCNGQEEGDSAHSAINIATDSARICMWLLD